MSFPVIKGVLLSSKQYTWNTADSLGKGASAVVYLGRQRETGLVVAVKSFHKHLLPSSRNADLRELELLRQLHHQNIIQLLDIQFEESSKQPVLVMEYCEGGSLHHMLEQPAYYYGLPEPEYLLVLTHVSDGMAYLRQQNVIHRDIKPGNIMRFITDEGSSIYKLTDFGAARNLEDEEQFDSLYGTEEYLHPGVYERAVLRHPTGKSFDARVDLWSLGVTFYHAATGKLPFQPYGGRSNKELMFQIISQKESGVISGIQKKDNGPIDWKRELPESCPLSNGLRSVVTPMLSGLMEADQSKMITYDSFFQIVEDLKTKKAVSVFHVATCQELVVYLDDKCVFQNLQASLTALTSIAVENQILLVDGRRLEEVVDLGTAISEYPTRIREEGIFLFQLSPREEFRLRHPEIYPFPDIQTYSGMDMDSRHANMCSAQGELISRYAKIVVKKQDLLLKASLCLRLYVESRQMSYQPNLSLMQQMLRDFHIRLENFFDMVERLKNVLANCRGNKKDADTLDKVLTEKVVRPVFMKAKDRLDEIHRYGLTITTKLNQNRSTASRLSSPCHEDKCSQKLAHHLSVISGIQSRFRRDKNVRSQMTPHDENIHHFERQKLYRHCKSLYQLLASHCYVNLAKLFQDTLRVTDSMIRCLHNIKKIDDNMASVLTCHQQLSEKVFKMHQSLKDIGLKDSGYSEESMEDSLETSSSTASDMSLQTQSLEKKLLELKDVLDTTSGILRGVETGSLPVTMETDKQEVLYAEEWAGPAD